MTDATHTPGPWTVSKPSGNYIDTATGSIAALTYGATKADAHLIAAAPDLLVALEYLLEQTIGQDQQYGIELSEGEAIAEQKALAAITKAKGN